MELLSEGRNFRLAQKEELPNILDFLEKYLPESVKFHQTLKTYLNDFVWEFHFYLSRSWPDDPICLHFPGMTSSPNGLLYESFSVFCPTTHLDLLSLVEEEDILLDWSKPIFLNFTHTNITDRLEAFYNRIGTVEKIVGDVYMCMEPKLDDQPENIQEGFEIRQLIKDDVQTIHELYPANDMEAVGVFEKLVLQLPAYGVFCSGELAAWMVQSYYGAMFSMQTRPEFRRRGYGILLAKKLMNLVVERGYIPYVVIRPENEASKSLYSKIGFQKIYQTVRAVFKPFETTKEEGEEEGKEGGEEEGKEGGEEEGKEGGEEEGKEGGEDEEKGGVDEEKGGVDEEKGGEDEEKGGEDEEKGGGGGGGGSGGGEEEEKDCATLDCDEP